jgi:hypothetical protein
MALRGKDTMATLFTAYSKTLCQSAKSALASLAMVASALVAASDEAHADFTISYSGVPFDYNYCMQNNYEEEDICVPGAPVRMSFTFGGTFPQHYTGWFYLSSNQLDLKQSMQTFAGQVFSMVPSSELGSGLEFKNGNVTSWDIVIGCDWYGLNDPGCPNDVAATIQDVSKDQNKGSGPPYDISLFLNDNTAPVYVLDATKTGTWSITTKRSASPVAANESAYSIGYKPIGIDLTYGATGSPYKASLVGTATGGTVSGFPGPYVTFTPTEGMPQGQFQFTLTNVAGTSNTATATITATLLDPQTKAVFAQLADSFSYVSSRFEYASIVTEAFTGSLKAAAGDVLIDGAVHVLSSGLARNDQLKGQEVDFELNLMAFAKFADKKLTRTNVVSIPLQIDALVFEGLSLASNVIAADPPDSNYKVVTVPDKVHFIKTGDQALDKLEKDYLKYAGYEAAVVHAAERWQGAELANDQYWETEQESAFETYSADVSNMLATLQADNQSLSGDLPPVDINSFKGGAKGLAKLYEGQCGKPLPKELNDILLSYSLTQDEINQDMCTYLKSVIPQDVSTDFGSALNLTLP